MIEKWFIELLSSIDIIEFGKEFGVLTLFNLFWIIILSIILNSRSKKMINHIEKIKDNEIDRISEQRNKYQKMVFKSELLTSSKKKKKKH